MTDDQIKHMVDRFLAWRLPDPWHPDAGIKFEPVYNLGTEFQGRHKPTGTNLFDYTQATAMVRHMLEGLPEEEWEGPLTDEEQAMIDGAWEKHKAAQPPAPYGKVHTDGSRSGGMPPGTNARPPAPQDDLTPGTRCTMCGVAAPASLWRECDRPECIYRPQGDVPRDVAESWKAKAENYQQERAEALADIANMMANHVDNWPAPKTLKTAITLIGKTLDAMIPKETHNAKLTKSDAGDAVGEPAASAPPASGAVEADLVVNDAVHVVFDGPPGPEAGRFVECETPDGRSINAGEWIERDDGYWELRIVRAQAPISAERDALRAKLAAAEAHLRQAADNLESGAKLYNCPGLEAAAKLARAAIATEKPAS